MKKRFKKMRVLALVIALAMVVQVLVGISLPAMASGTDIGPGLQGSYDHVFYNNPSGTDVVSTNFLADVMYQNASGSQTPASYSWNTNAYSYLNGYVFTSSLSMLVPGTKFVATYNGDEPYYIVHYSEGWNPPNISPDLYGSRTGDGDGTLSYATIMSNQGTNTLYEVSLLNNNSTGNQNSGVTQFELDNIPLNSDITAFEGLDLTAVPGGDGLTPSTAMDASVDVSNSKTTVTAADIGAAAGYASVQLYSDPGFLQPAASVTLSDGQNTVYAAVTTGGETGDSNSFTAYYAITVNLTLTNATPTVLAAWTVNMDVISSNYSSSMGLYIENDASQAGVNAGWCIYEDFSVLNIADTMTVNFTGAAPDLRAGWNDAPVLAPVSSTSTSAAYSVSAIKSAMSTGGNIMLVAESSSLVSTIVFEGAPAAATGMSVNPPALTVGIGAISQLAAVFTPSGATAENVEWSSSNNNVATVDPGTGMVIGVAGGTATITAASTESSLTAACAVTVPSASVAVGTWNINQTVSDWGGPNGLFIENSTDQPDVLQSWFINEDFSILNSSDTMTVNFTGAAPDIRVGWNTAGIVAPSYTTATTAVYSTSAIKSALSSAGGGNIMIWAASPSYVSTIVFSTMVVSAEGLAVTPDTLSIGTGYSAVLTAVFTPANTTNKAVTWTSGDDNIATVGPSGYVTGVNAGSTTITATSADGGFEAACAVTVTLAVPPVVIGTWNINQTVSNWNGPNGLFITNGLDNPDVLYGNWAINEDFSILDVSDTMTVNYTGAAPDLRAGWNTAGIVAPLTVTPTAAIYSVSSVKAALSGGGNIMLWAASASNVSTVVFTGALVNAASLAISPAALSIGVGMISKLSPVFTPASTTYKAVTWSSGDDSIASVSPDGYVTAVSVGETTITAVSAVGGFTATCDVTVKPETLLGSWVLNTDIAAYGTTGTNACCIMSPDAIIANNAAGWGLQEDFNILNAADIMVVNYTGTAPSLYIQWMSMGMLVQPMSDTGSAVSYDVSKLAGNNGLLSLHASASPSAVGVVDFYGTPVPVTGMTFDPDTANVRAGFSTQLTPVFTPANATNKNIASWTSSDDAIAAVDAAGNVTGVSAGEAAITAVSADGGFSAVCTVTVAPPYTPGTPPSWPSGYYTDWINTDPGVPGGIPDASKEEVFTTINAGTDKTADDAATINAAILAASTAAAISGKYEVIELSAGIFYCKEAISFDGADHVILRGAGIAQTYLKFTTPDTRAVQFGNNTDQPGFYNVPVYNVAASVAMNDTTITTTTAADYQPGDIICIDCMMTGGSDPGSGSQWYGDLTYMVRGSGNGQYGPKTDGQPVSPSGNSLDPANFRHVKQYVAVAGVSGDVITLAEPINIDFPLAQKPQVWLTSTLSTMTQNCGIEGLTTQRPDANVIASAWGPATIDFGINTAYCWALGVENDGSYIDANGAWGGTHCYVSGYHNTVSGCYFHDSSDNAPGGAGYGIRLGGSDCLITNNVVTNLCKPILSTVDGGGNVVSYNYVPNAQTIPTQWEESAIDLSHGGYDHANLYEGNLTPNIQVDNTHGNNGGNTLFRNDVLGMNRDDTGITGPFVGIANDGGNNELASVGNVLFAPDSPLLGNAILFNMPSDLLGADTVPANLQSANSNRPAVYAFGTFGGFPNLPPTADPSFYYSTIYKDYNYVTNGLFSTVNATDPAIPGPLPPSLYLHSAPDFFTDGGYAWPWVNSEGATDAERVQALPAADWYNDVLVNLDESGANDYKPPVVVIPEPVYDTALPDLTLGDGSNPTFFGWGVVGNIQTTFTDMSDFTKYKYIVVAFDRPLNPDTDNVCLNISDDAGGYVDMSLEFQVQLHTVNGGGCDKFYLPVQALPHLQDLLALNKPVYMALPCWSSGTLDHLTGFYLTNQEPGGSLSDLTMDGTTVDGFAPDTTSYAVSVDNAVTSADLEATADDGYINLNPDWVPPANWQHWSDYTPGAYSTVDGDTGAQALNPGDNTFNVTVTAETGMAQKTYTVVVTRAETGTASDDASLIEISGKPVTYTVTDDTAYVTINGYPGAATVTAEDILTAPDASAQLLDGIGTEVSSVAISDTVPTVNFSIIVTAQDGVTQTTYNVTVDNSHYDLPIWTGSKTAARWNTLVTLQAGTDFDPSLFVPGTSLVWNCDPNQYAPYVNNITAGDVVTSSYWPGNSSSSPYYGETDYATILSNLNDRSGSSPNLPDLSTFSSITLTAGGNAGTDISTLYSVLLMGIPRPQHSVISVTLPATESVGAGQTVALTPAITPDDAVYTGIFWSSDNEDAATVDTDGVVTGVAPGTATITVTVTTADGEYTAQCIVTVLSSDASLSDLTVNPGTLAPAFDPAVTEYTVSVDNSVASIDIEAAASDANAEITGDTGSQNLAEGANTFTVTVTAEDGVTQIIYTVTVTRAAAPAYDAKYDINGDGKIDAADLALIMANLNKKASSSAVAKKCDLDGDGMVTMMDYQMLAAYIASL